MSEAGTPAADAARGILDGGAVHVRTDGEPFFFSSGFGEVFPFSLAFFSSLDSSLLDLTRLDYTRLYNRLD